MLEKLALLKIALWRASALEQGLYASDFGGALRRAGSEACGFLVG